MCKKSLVAILTILILAAFIGTAGAADLVVATPYEPSVDPHFLYLSSNAAYARNVFAMLVDRDEDANIDPKLCLAESWKVIDDYTWEFKLRKGVKFHNGLEITAEDVVFSIDRIPKVPNNPASYVMNIQMIDDVIIKDSYTLIIKTNEPYPLLPRRLAGVSIVSKEVVGDATTADFTSGKVAIGTGPYKFVEYVPGDHYTIARFDDYFGPRPAYDKVTFKIMSDDAARVAALLGGDVDIVENFPPTEVPTLKNKKGFKVVGRPSSRTVFLEIDSNRDQSPYVTDLEGKPLAANPLKDVRVRDAISKAIDRNAIVEKVMLGLAEPANQLIGKGLYSYNPEIKDEPYDPQRAKQLLAEAGYPNGFGLTIHAPNDRYVNDEKIAQAVAQMLARIGLKMKVETMPKSVYFGRLNKREFSLAMLGWDNSLTGSSLMCIAAAFHTYDKEKGYGTWNGGGYSNAEFDKAIEQASITFDLKKHEELLQKSMKILIDDQAAIPLHSQYTIFGAKEGVDYTPRVDEHFYAPLAKPAK